MVNYFRVFLDSGESFIWPAKSIKEIYANCGDNYFVSGGKWNFPKPLRVDAVRS